MGRWFGSSLGSAIIRCDSTVLSIDLRSVYKTKNPVDLAHRGRNTRIIILSEKDMAL